MPTIYRTFLTLFVLSLLASALGAAKFLHDVGAVATAPFIGMVALPIVVALVCFYFIIKLKR